MAHVFDSPKILFNSNFSHSFTHHYHLFWCMEKDGTCIKQQKLPVSQFVDGKIKYFPFFFFWLYNEYRIFYLYNNNNINNIDNKKEWMNFSFFSWPEFYHFKLYVVASVCLCVNEHLTSNKWANIHLRRMKQ